MRPYLLLIPFIVLLHTSPVLCADWDEDWHYPQCQENGLISTSFNDYRATMDAEMMMLWCSPPIDPNLPFHYINGLNLLNFSGLLYWPIIMQVDGGLCQPNGYVTRLINAAVLLDQVYWHRSNSTFGDLPMHWLAFVFDRSDQGYVATCRQGVVATNWSNHPTELHDIFFKNYSAPQRASTLVHEGVHDDIPHSDAGGLCNADTCGTSCDDMFGIYNAQTTQIQALGDQIDTYMRSPTTGELYIRNWDPANNICGYIPFLTERQRFAVNDLMNRKLNNCFQIAPDPMPYYSRTFPTPAPGSLLSALAMYDYGGLIYANDLVREARWECHTVCDVDDFDFALGGYRSCNEDVNPANVSRNQERRLACLLANLSAQTATESQRREIQREFEETTATNLCFLGVSDAYLEQKCSNAVSLANTLDEMETLWYQDIPPIEETGSFGWDSAFNECAQGFCQQKFDSQWITDARTACYEWTDPAGCLDHACGKLFEFGLYYGEYSTKYLESVACRMEFIENNGNPDAYILDAGICEDKYHDCIIEEAYPEWLAAKQQGQCSLYDPPPPYPVPIPPIIPTFKLLLKELQYIGEYEDYSEFMSQFPDAHFDVCEASLTLCEQTEQLGRRIVSEFVAVSEVPEEVFPTGMNPENLPFANIVNEIDANIRRLSRIAAGVDSVSGITPGEALEQLSMLPEAQHAISKVLGKEAYFGLFGTAGLEKVFGPEVVGLYPDADIQFQFMLNPQQQALVPQMIEVKNLRLKTVSDLTLQHLDIAVANQEAMFNFIKNVAGAETPTEINTLLDGLATVGQ